MPVPTPFSRREFGTLLAAAALPGAGDAAAALAAQDTPAAAPPSLIDRQLELVRQQYPDARLDAAALAEIREDLELQQARGVLLSRVPLANSDEPAFVIRATPPQP